jgi:transposase
MMPVIEEFVRKYELDNFVVVADSGLMNEQNIADMEQNGYKYIIGARIRTESKKVTEWILSHSWAEGQMAEYDKGDGRRLLVGYTDNRARKDAYNREKGVRRLEKAYRNGRLSKENINRRGYNKFLEMKNKLEVSINYEKIKEDALWDGLKGYLTNTELPAEQIYTAYHNLWTVELAFRIAKSKLEVRPMFHFTRKRIEAHICICFVALKVYKELDRILKLNGIKLGIDKVLRMAKTVTTLQVRLPLNGQLLTKTMVMKRHKPIEKLFDENFWVT